MKRRSSLHFVIILSHVVCLRSQAKSFVPHCITVFLRIYGSGLPLLYFLASIFMFLQPLSWAKMPWSMPKGVWFGVVRKAVAAEQLIISYSLTFIDSESCEVNASFHCFILLQMSFRLFRLWSLWSFRLSSSSSQVLGRQVQPSVGCQEAPQPCSILKHSNIFEQNMFEYNMYQHVIFQYISLIHFWYLLIYFHYVFVYLCQVFHGVPSCFFKKKLIKWLAFHKFVTLKAASLWYEDGQRGHWQHVLCCLDAIGCNARYAPICSLQDLDLTMFDLSSEDPELFELLWTKSLLQRRPTGAITCVIFCYHIQVHIVSRPWLGLVMRTVRLN